MLSCNFTRGRSQAETLLSFLRTDQLIKIFSFPHVSFGWLRESPAADFVVWVTSLGKPSCDWWLPGFFVRRKTLLSCLLFKLLRLLTKFRILLDGQLQPVGKAAIHRDQ